MPRKSQSVLRRETDTDRKLEAWLVRNAPWLMKLKSEDVMWRVGLELNHGRLTGRSVDDSLVAAASLLRQKYEDGQGYQIETANPEKKEGNKNGS